MLSPGDLRVNDYVPHAVMAPHDHDYPSLNLVVRGDFVERIGKSERHYKGGYFTFGAAGITHSQQFGVDGARQIVIRPQESWLSYLSDSGVDLRESPFVSAPLFDEIGQRLLRECEENDSFSVLSREGIVLEAIAAFGRSRVSPVAIGAPLWLRRARDYMHDHACLPLSVRDIACAAGRHEIHLAREFRRFFGTSVGVYLRRLKTEEAARLLLQPRADITDVALRCGFAGHAHLCRVFKTHYGVTPSQYRARQ